jgi:digeranylgeranylglycerophospholipid reductase
MMDKTHDVIVIGAGPVGSHTAYLLSKEGLNVGIFEKNTAIGEDVNCTGLISTECFTKFKLSRDIIHKPFDSIKAFSPSGNCIQYQSSAPIAYVINRSLFDNKMNRLAVDAGATTYLDMRVDEIVSTNGDFRITVKKGKENREFKSKVGVLANGFELNTLRDIIKRPKKFLYGIQTDAIMDNVSTIEVYFGNNIAPGSFGWVVPTGEKSTKIGLITKENPSSFLKKFLQNPLIKNRILSSDEHIKCSLIPFGSIPKSYAERLLIVGEAAGQVKTTTGGGIYFGLLCSAIAARTIKKAFQRGDFSAKMFKEYETTWKKTVEPEVKAGIKLRNLFSRFSDSQIDFLVDLAKRDGILPDIKNSNFDWQKDIILSLSRHLISKKLFRR